MPADVAFSTLETLSISCYIIGLDDLIARCPRLRVLRLNVSSKHDLRTVHSTSLQELSVNSIDHEGRFDIITPVLRRLTMSLRCLYKQINISILAPMLETVSWDCSYCYVEVPILFGHWRLAQVMLKTAEEEQGKLTSLHIHAHTVSVLSW
jgi:hypothetical protein